MIRKGAVVDPEGFPRFPWNPPFELANLHFPWAKDDPETLFPPQPVWKLAIHNKIDVDTPLSCTGLQHEL